MRFMRFPPKDPSPVCCLPHAMARVLACSPPPFIRLPPITRVLRPLPSPAPPPPPLPSPPRSLDRCTGPTSTPDYCVTSVGERDWNSNRSTRVGCRCRCRCRALFTQVQQQQQPRGEGDCDATAAAPATTGSWPKVVRDVLISPWMLLAALATFFGRLAVPRERR